jgi:hypothetical protein
MCCLNFKNILLCTDFATWIKYLVKHKLLIWVHIITKPHWLLLRKRVLNDCAFGYEENAERDIIKVTNHNPKPIKYVRFHNLITYTLLIYHISVSFFKKTDKCVYMKHLFISNKTIKYAILKQNI